MRSAPVFAAALLLSASLIAGAAVAVAGNAPADGPAAPQGLVLQKDDVTATIQSPRDAASGQATGDTGTPAPPALKTEWITSIQAPGDGASSQATGDARGTETAQTGQFMDSGVDGQEIKRKPPAKRSRKARRRHKP